MKSEDRPPKLGWSQLRDDRNLPVWDWLEHAAPVHCATSSRLDPHFDAHRLAALRTAYQDVTGALMRHLAGGLVLACRTIFHGSGEQVAGVWHVQPWPDEDGLKLRAQHLWCALFGWRYLVGPRSLAVVRQEFFRAHWINEPLDPSAFLRGRRGQLFANWCNQHGRHPEEVIAWFRDLKSQDKSFFGASPQTLARLSKSITLPFITVNAGLLFAGEDLPESEDPYARLDQGVRDYNGFLRQTKLADLAIKPADNPIALMAVGVMRTPATAPAKRNAAALLVRRFIADRAPKGNRGKEKSYDAASLDTVLADVYDPSKFSTPVEGDALHRFISRKTRYPEGRPQWANVTPLGAGVDRLVVTGNPQTHHLIPGSDEHLDTFTEPEGFMVPGSEEHVRLLDRAEAPSPTLDIETAFEERLLEDDMPAARIPYSQQRRPRLRDGLGEHTVKYLVAFARARGCKVTDDTIRSMAKTGTIATREKPHRVTRKDGAVKSTLGEYRFDSAALNQLDAWVKEKRKREDRACLVDLVRLFHGNTARRSAELWVKRCETRGLGFAEIVEEVGSTLIAEWKVRASLQGCTPETLRPIVREQLVRVREENREERREDRRTKKRGETANA